MDGQKNALAMFYIYIYIKYIYIIYIYIYIYMIYMYIIYIYYKNYILFIYIYNKQIFHINIKKMVRRKGLWVWQSDATRFLTIIRGYILMQDMLWWNYWYIFFKKSTLFGKYRMLPKFSRLGAGSVENYVDELIQFF